jgi:hypothetical protein
MILKKIENFSKKKFFGIPHENPHLIQARMSRKSKQKPRNQNKKLGNPNENFF